jgi:DNA repair exonuclease SbcCD ATPase subunit
MAINIKEISLRNFLSVGAVTQTINLNRNGITLVLGENLDMGGNGSRNGVGKTTLAQAISYGLYGQPLTNIKLDNLVNKINQRNMTITINFEVNGHKYRIERGRKPNYFRYIVDDQHVNIECTDEAQGENKNTQFEIEQLLGISHTLFKHVVVLNTYSEPFLDLGASKQREIIEELLGITQLSKKAEKLKDLIKTTKSEIEHEDFRVRTVKNSNEKIQNTIVEFQRKVDNWEQIHLKELNTIESAIAHLEKLDIDNELESHSDVEVYKELSTGVAQFNKEILSKTRHSTQLEMQLNGLLIQYEKASDKSCPMCSQNIKDHHHVNIMNDLETRISSLDSQVTVEKTELTDITLQLDGILTVFNGMSKPNVFYSTLKEALEHKNTLNQLHKDLDKEVSATNPYVDQAKTLTETLQEVNYTHLNKLVRDREHQEFLLKLLTNKDSFIRKRIIDQNLAYLNKRLAEYLDKLGLPHIVKFLNDLSTEITFMGQDLDFRNLSRGEGTRLILGLSLSFRDMFETTNTAIDLLFIDEMLDMGIDSVGLDNTITLLEKLTRERNKNIFIISHRDELIPRVTSTLTVIKENNFTTFSFDQEQVE